VRGVLDRITEIADYPEPCTPDHRPPYHYQVPLQFLPGIGAVALGKLLNRLGTEMKVLHETDPADLELVIGPKLAALILQARQGALTLAPGGGGRYGKAIGSGTEGQLSMGL
jgi:PHP family Zn ribbon phosphoesterase